MAWVLLDDDFPNHPKTVAVGRSAAIAYVFGLCYCRKYFTGGFIPESAVPTLGATAREVERLTTIYPPAESAYWLKVKGGYRVHGYTYDDIGDKGKADSRKEKKRAAGRLGGIKAASNRVAQRIAEAVAQPVADAQQTPTPMGWVGSSAQALEARKEQEPTTREYVGLPALWFEELRAAYPSERVTGNYWAVNRFESIVAPGGVPNRATFQRMMRNLESQKAGEQWAKRGKIPRLDNWLENDWEQEHKATSEPPSTSKADRALSRFRAEMAK